MSFRRVLFLFAVLLSVGRSSDAHAAWVRDGAPLIPGQGVQNIRSVVPDGAGGAYIGWEQGGGDMWQVFAIRVNSQGDVVQGWPANGLPVFDPTRSLIAGTSLFADDAHHLFVVWCIRTATTKTFVMLQCLTDKGELAPGWPAPGVRLGLGTIGIDFVTHAVSDGADGAIVSWGPATLIDSLGPDVRAQRVDKSAQLLWGPEAREITPTAFWLAGPQLLSDGSGGAFMSWSSGPDDAGQIYVQRITSQGDPAPGWPPGGVAAASFTGNRVRGPMVSDGNGGVFIGWSESRVASGATDADVYAQRVLGNGTIAPGWARDGMVVCAQPRNQLLPLMCTDDAGGVIFGWTDFRPAALFTGVFAQRLDPSGHRLWADAGVPVCTAPDLQKLTALESDGKGGAWAAWEDWRNTYLDTDIYGAHLLADGSFDPDFPSHEAAICTAAGDQYSPMIAADAGYKAIAVWPDDRFTYPVAQIYLTQFMDPENLGPAPEPLAPEPPVLKRFGASLSPASGLTFSLPSSGVTRLEVFDVSGRRIESRDLGMLGAGDHAVRLQGLEGRPAGVYLLRLSQGERVWSARVLLLR
jgi:hypothetical protein